MAALLASAPLSLCVAAPRQARRVRAAASQAPVAAAVRLSCRERLVPGARVVCAARGSVSASFSRRVTVSVVNNSQQAIVPDEEKSITKFSFGTIGLAVGSVLLVSGFLGYFNFIEGSDNSLSSLLLIYGFPITLIGFALKYAELKPLDCISYADAVAARTTQATPIQLQIRSDVTRYRYGDEQHLDEALERIFRINKAGGIRRNQCPTLARLREEMTAGCYTLVLGFESPNLPIAEWETRLPKIESFFGPGIKATITPLEGTNLEVALVSDGSAAGGVKEDEEVLPPLMPGLAPRVVKKAAK